MPVSSGLTAECFKEEIRQEERFPAQLGDTNFPGIERLPIAPSVSPVNLLENLKRR